MEGKQLRRVRESFGRCTLKKGFYESLVSSLEATSLDLVSMGSESGQIRQYLKNDIAFLLLCAGDQQAGKIALSRIGLQQGKTTLNIKADQIVYWSEALLSGVRKFDVRFTPEVEAGWHEVIDSGFRYIQEHRAV